MSKKRTSKSASPAKKKLAKRTKSLPPKTNAESQVPKRKSAKAVKKTKAARSAATIDDKGLQNKKGANPVVEPGQVLLGRSFRTIPHPNGTYGEQATVSVSTPVGDSLIAGDHYGHLVTFAPPGIDRTRSVIIPNLLAYPGSVVVVDSTGEAYRATASARLAMGQSVVRLDPFGVVEPTTDAFNPLDLFPTEGHELESMCRAVVDIVFPPSQVDHYWRQYARSLLHAVLGYVVTVPERRTVADLVNVFPSDDVVYNLAVVLDTIGKRIPPWSYTQISRFLQEADVNRTRILSEIILRNQPLTAIEVQKALDERTETAAEKKARKENGGVEKQRAQSLAVAEAFLTGQPVSVYIVVPPTHLRTHAVLLRLWIGLLLRGLGSRPRSESPPLFLLDHATVLEHMLPVEAAAALGRRAGVRVWTFWDDLCQLRTTYPAAWTVLLNGTGAVQVFGSSDYLYAAEAGAVLGIDHRELLLLDTDEQIVRTANGVLRLKKLDVPADH